MIGNDILISAFAVIAACGWDSRQELGIPTPPLTIFASCRVERGDIAISEPGPYKALDCDPRLKHWQS